ncbi:cell wall elongation regulator TseB-like domain-containing protein [Brevibacillus dissolubilis]|uniref:cell wall elongation regulator TseB-like domain-containing protein n=1 Tax=Brevibacillus dissolubilis TaxID=1844116 RepID=UPI001117338A|nr:DUF5590 domain-containing protein [Brevibacillus dissolubilis]
MYLRITIISLICILALAGSFAYHLASSVVGDRSAFEEKVREWTAKRTTITQIDEISEYRGKETWAVVIGKNRFGTPVIAWLNEKHAKFDSLEGAITEKDITATLQKNDPTARIMHIVPGMEGEQRFWETLFVDKQNRYNYVYYDFKTGKVLKSYSVNPTAT